MARVLDTNPQPQPRSSTIFDRGSAAPKLFDPSKSIGGVSLPPGPRLEKSVGDPNNGQFFSWDGVLRERGVQTLIESDANGTPALWKGESTGGGRVVNLATGAPMSAPMRPYQPGITGDPPHEGSQAGEAHPHYAYDAGPLDPQAYPQGPAPGSPPAGKMGRAVPFADQLVEAGILGGGPAHGWIDWNAQMSGQGGEARRAQDAVNQGAMAGQPAPKGIPPAMPTAKMSIDAFDVGPMLDQLLGLMGEKREMTAMFSAGTKQAGVKKLPDTQPKNMPAALNIAPRMTGKQVDPGPKQVSPSRTFPLTGKQAGPGPKQVSPSRTFPLTGKKQEHPVSEAQRRWAFAAEERGELLGGTARKWSRRVKGQDLPASTGKMSEGETRESTRGRGSGQEFVYGQGDEDGGQKPEEVKKSVDDFLSPLGALIKAAGHKYKSRKKVGGKWVYDYGEKRAPRQQSLSFDEPKPERTPQTLGQGEHDKIATQMRALVEKAPNHPHRDLEKIRQAVRASVNKLQLSGFEEAAKTFSQLAGETAKVFKDKDKGGTSMEESLARAMHNELRGAVNDLKRYFTGIAEIRARKAKKSMDTDITMYDSAGRALRKGLHVFRSYGDDKFEAIPEDYLYDYLVAFVEEAFEHEQMEPKQYSAHDRLEKMACAVMGELVAYLPYNSNLRRACEKFGCTKDTIARILVEKGFLKPASDTYHHTDYSGNAAMGAYLTKELQLSVAPFISAEPAPVTPRELHNHDQDVSHLVKAEPSDPFQALMARRRAEVHAAWAVPALPAGITASDSCPVHSGREIQKSMQLWNPMLPCTCGETPNAYG
jgi:hypothetical protein